MATVKSFTGAARRALTLAHESAARMNHSQIGTEHLLLGLAREETGIAGTVLRKQGLDAEHVEHAIRSRLAQGPKFPERIDLAEPTQRAVDQAGRDAEHAGHREIGTAYLLLGILSQKDSKVVSILQRLGMPSDQLLELVLKKLKQRGDEGE